MNIPAGYQLHITTWENDADNYTTQIMSGLTKADVNFYLEIARKFVSTNVGQYDQDVWTKNGEGWGNRGHTAEELGKLLHEMAAKYPDISESIKAKLHDYLHENPEFEDINQWFDDLLGVCSEAYYDIENFTKVFDSAKVFSIPVECSDVSGEFKGEFKE